MIGEPMCRGCMYSGYPHLESCPEADHNKYRAAQPSSAASEPMSAKRSQPEWPCAMHAERTQCRQCDRIATYLVSVTANANWEDGYIDLQQRAEAAEASLAALQDGIPEKTQYAAQEIMDEGYRVAQDCDKRGIDPGRIAWIGTEKIEAILARIFGEK